MRITSLAVAAIGLLLVGCAGNYRGLDRGAGADVGADGAPIPATAALDVDGFRAAEEGVAVAGQPSPGDLRQAAARGYRTVVNFRTADEGAGEEEYLVKAAGLAYHNIPVEGSGVTGRHADELARILEDPAARPVLLHCASGNRVGAVWALFAARYRGLAPAAAVDEGRRVGLTKSATVEAVERELGLRLD